MKNSMANMPNNEKVKRKIILDFGIFFLSESSFTSPCRSAYLVEGKVQQKTNNVSFAFTHTYTLVKTKNFVSFPKRGGGEGGAKPLRSFLSFGAFL